MTALSSEAIPGDSPSVTTTHYERLRRHVLGDATATGGFGLVVLIREGVAAWLGHATAQPVALTHTKDQAVPTQMVPDDLHADVICVLANMAMASCPEVHA